MNESLGSIPSLALVIVFIAAISGYIAFNINYSKAFKYKSKLIDIIEKNDNEIDQKVKEEIGKYKNEINYSVAPEQINTVCGKSGNYTVVSDQGWCYKVYSKTDKEGKGITKKYVKIKTLVSVDVPVINKLLPNLKYFQIDGSTKTTVSLNK